MDVQKLRAAFVSSQTVMDKVQTPVAMLEHPTLVVHVLPLAGHFRDDRIEPRVIVDRLDVLNASEFVQPVNARFNLEGLLLGSSSEGARFARAYMQLFRNGAIESVATYSRLNEPLAFD